ncbi:uncharacterized protein BDZ99DRAFT_517572 [Mytilinidion resinicola]|uniref:Zn(2)-C6 fungal-type domain-containing protein n=1 Tax=Mytilinidion resinicola TaxID=574789 RepID=A0A6A6YXK7_9PEZI|nr:uncharacterized protein BDZ99DRAFT_517572 [Mytilinidion resinicola]KAF2813298.1 hypothetical protein BDZ99DRAFT_517572 [Mytilinidion resinicola]
MPSRRPHHKTRRGCTSCKKRRIKCDEHTPECHNCTKKNLTCSLLTLVPSSRLSSSSSPTPVPPSEAVARRVFVFHQTPENPTPTISALSSLTASFERCFSDSPTFFQSKGKELIHHFLTKTSTTLATHSPTQRVWQVAIPQIATAHPYLIHGIIAATSLHLSELHEEAEAKEAFANIAVRQMDLSLSNYRNQLSNITAENCNALFAFSILTIIYQFRTFRDESAALLSLATQQDVDMPWVTAQLKNVSLGLLMNMRGGARAILNPSWSWISKGPLADIAERNWWPTDRSLKSPRHFEEDHRLHQLEELWMIPGQPYENEHDVLKTALQDLRDTYALVAQLTDDSTVGAVSCTYKLGADDTVLGTLKDRGAIFKWPVGLSQEFMKLGEQQHPHAFVIIAHWAVLLHRISDLWFLEGVASTFVATAASLLGKDNRSCIEWPIRELGLQLPDGL